MHKSYDEDGYGYITLQRVGVWCKSTVCAEYTHHFRAEGLNFTFVTVGPFVMLRECIRVRYDPEWLLWGNLSGTASVNSPVSKNLFGTGFILQIILRS